MVLSRLRKNLQHDPPSQSGAPLDPSVRRRGVGLKRPAQTHFLRVLSYAGVMSQATVGHLSVADSLELWVFGLSDPNPVLVACARGLARQLDGDRPGDPEVSCELRLTVAALAADDDRMPADAG
jgi:hypothetical protein